MKELLKIKLRDFLLQNRPDLLVTLQSDNSTSEYLEDKVSAIGDLAERYLNEGKPPYIIAELCMVALTADLGKSRFQFLAEILDHDFMPAADKLRLNGLLNYELLNLVQVCEPVFKELGFDEEDRMLRYALTGTIQEYAENNWNLKDQSLWLSQSGKN